MAKQKYTVTHSHLGRWTRKYGTIPRCRICDHTLELDEKVERRSGKPAVKAENKRLTTPKFYHERCLNEGSVPKSDPKIKS